MRYRVIGAYNNSYTFQYRDRWWWYWKTSDLIFNGVYSVLAHIIELEHKAKHNNKVFVEFQIR